MCSFGSCKTCFEFLSQFRKVRNAFECFVTQVQTHLPKTKRVWPMKINVICTVDYIDVKMLLLIIVVHAIHMPFSKENIGPSSHVLSTWKVAVNKNTTRARSSITPQNLLSNLTNIGKKSPTSVMDRTPHTSLGIYTMGPPY